MEANIRRVSPGVLVVEFNHSGPPDDLAYVEAFFSKLVLR